MFCKIKLVLCFLIVNNHTIGGAMPKQMFLNNWRVQQSGTFFADCALQIFGGTRSASNYNLGDIEHDHLNARIEVKSRSNNGAIIIREKQLLALCESVGFPFDCAWYVIFSYRNTGLGQYKRFSQAAKNKKDVDAYLAKNLMQMYIFDAMILNKMNQAGEFSKKEIPGDPGTHIELHVERWKLRKFIEEPNPCFTKYKLRGFHSKAFKVKTVFHGRNLNFEILMALRSKDISRVIEFLFQSRLPYPEADEEFRLEAVSNG